MAGARCATARGGEVAQESNRPLLEGAALPARIGRIRLFAKRRISSAYIPEILVRMRAGGHSNRSLKNALCGNLESWSAVRSHGLAVSPLSIARKLSPRVGSFFCQPPAAVSNRLGFGLLLGIAFHDHCALAAGLAMI